MPSYAGPSAARPGDVAGVLRLLVYLVLAVVLMVLDHRGGWLRAVRAQAEVAVQPLWWVAGLPSRAGVALREDAVTRSQLMRDNEVLRGALLVSGARTLSSVTRAPRCRGDAATVPVLPDASSFERSEPLIRAPSSAENELCRISQSTLAVRSSLTRSA